MSTAPVGSEISISRVTRTIREGSGDPCTYESTDPVESRKPGLTHVSSILPMHHSNPEGFHGIHERGLDSEEIVFDPAVHLQIEFPKGVISSDFEESSYPVADDANFSLGYCTPFRLLSDEGVKVLKSIVLSNEKHAGGNERIKKCLRGLGYRSKFVEDFTYCPEVINVLGNIAGKPVAPHSCSMNHGHTNFGRKILPPKDPSEPHKPVIVDQWHVDSVDYVCVLMLSDLSETVGGELEVFHKKGVRDNADFIARGVTAEDAHLVRKAQYPGAGYCCFMHGSQILHRVAPIFSAPETRISFVSSYMSRNVFDPDSTRYHTFAEQLQDGHDVASVEFCRHKAWRVGGQLDYLKEKLPFGTPAEDIAKLLRDAAAELERAASLITREESDEIGWVSHEKVQALEDQKIKLHRSKL